MRGARSIAVVLALAASACASGGIPRPTPADVARAQARWPDASAKSLEQGRDLYVARCSTCHALHSAGAYDPARWDLVLDKMSARARLSPGQREQIRRYLVAAGEG